MSLRRPLCALITAGSLGFAPLSAAAVDWLPAIPALQLGVIKVDVHMAELFTRAGAVLIAEVASVDAAGGKLTLTVGDALKGTSPGTTVTVDGLAAHADLLKTLKAKMSAVIVLGRKAGGAVHVGDVWLNCDGSPTALTCKERLDAPRSFSGRTVALAAVMRAYKAGNMTALLKGVEHNVFGGGPQDFGTIGGKAEALVVADANGDGKDDLIVGMGGAAKIFASNGKGLDDVTAKLGLGGAKGAPRAAGDANGDGKIDLLIGGTLWLNGASGFTASTVTVDIPADAQAVAIADANRDGKADIAVVTKSGKAQAWINPGSTDKPWAKSAERTLWSDAPAVLYVSISTDWGDDGGLYAMVARENGIFRYACDDAGGAVADAKRLTGEPLNQYYKKMTALKGGEFQAIHIDDNGKLDFWFNDGSGGRGSGGGCWANRGFGTFLVNPDAGGVLHGKGSPSYKPTSLIGAGDLYGDKFGDLVVINDDGKVGVVSNTPYKPHP